MVSEARTITRSQAFLHRHLGVILTVLVTIVLAIAAGVSHTLERVTTIEVKESQQEQAIAILPQINERLSHIEGALGIGDASKKGN